MSWANEKHNLEMAKLVRDIKRRLRTTHLTAMKIDNSPEVRNALAPKVYRALIEYAFPETARMPAPNTKPNQISVRNAKRKAGKSVLTWASSKRARVRHQHVANLHTKFVPFR